jgi:predicted branched-subunit amino acid permease
MRINDDFRRGFMVCAGVLVAFYVVGVATGVLKRIV